MNLTDKVILITGGRRVGLELAKMLGGRQARIAMTYHSSRERIESALDEMEAAGVETLAVEADLRDSSQADNAIQSVVERFGKLDVLVNMVSIFERVAFDDLTPAHYHQMIAVNLTAPYFSAIAASRAIRKNAPDTNRLKGKIVNIGDWSIDRPGVGQLPYIIAKGGLKTLTLALAKELAPEITVNMVEPGTIDPPESTTEEALQATEAQTPLGRIGSPDDVNRLILYLLEGTDFATGACFRVDGGRFLGMDSPDI